MIKVEEGFEKYLFQLFEYFGTGISALVLAYAHVWKAALILNISIVLAVVLAIILLKVGSEDYIVTTVMIKFIIIS